MFTRFLRLLICCIFISSYQSALAHVRGIYITQPTLENTKRITQLIKRSKQVGINTFIIDMKRVSRRYQKNIKLVLRNNIRYVARIVVFPRGGTRAQVASEKYWLSRLRLAKAAESYGADEIQLDYIRYRVKTRSSRQNAKNILRVIKWFKHRVNVPLQIAVFGETSFGPSNSIGQDIRLFAGTIDVLNPMVYPSHYAPYRYHSQRPYYTIEKSLRALNAMFNNNLPFKLYPYIEVANFRYRVGGSARIKYIAAQIRATLDNGADGWYAWSPNNKYYFLFRTLELHKGL